MSASVIPSYMTETNYLPTADNVSFLKTPNQVENTSREICDRLNKILKLLFSVDEASNFDLIK